MFTKTAEATFANILDYENEPKRFSTVLAGTLAEVTQELERPYEPVLNAFLSSLQDFSMVVLFPTSDDEPRGSLSTLRNSVARFNHSRHSADDVVDDRYRRITRSARKRIEINRDDRLARCSQHSAPITIFKRNEDHVGDGNAFRIDVPAIAAQRRNHCVFGGFKNAWCRRTLPGAVQSPRPFLRCGEKD